MGVGVGGSKQPGVDDCKLTLLQTGVWKLCVARTRKRTCVRTHACTHTRLRTSKKNASKSHTTHSPSPEKNENRGRSYFGYKTKREAVGGLRNLPHTHTLPPPQTEVSELRDELKEAVGGLGDQKAAFGEPFRVDVLLRDWAVRTSPPTHTHIYPHKPNHKHTHKCARVCAFMCVVFVCPRANVYLIP